MYDRKDKRMPKISINDNTDILIEILTRLDAPSLVAATSVCRLWRTLLTDDLLWERLCFRHVFPGVRPVVAALGGYQRLYTLCVRPVMARLGRASTRRATRGEMELSLSLFCVDYYERLGSGGGGGAAPSSLMFLCKPVNV